MDTFGNRLQKARLRKRMSQSTLAALSGVTARSIQNYESGDRMPNSIKITARLARALDTTTEALIGENDTTTEVRLLSSVSGTAQNFTDANIIETYRFPTNFTGEGEFFLLRVRGNSMTGAGIEPGDLVLVRRQSEANDGEIVVVSVDGETTLKRYYLEPLRHRIRLHPENLAMEDIFVEECIIHGVAFKVIKDL